MTGPAQSGVTGPAQSGVTGPAQAGVTGPVQAGVTGPAQSGMTGPAQAGVTGPAQAGVTGPAQAVRSRMVVGDGYDKEFGVGLGDHYGSVLMMSTSLHHWLTSTLCTYFHL